MPTQQKTCVGNQKTKKPRNCIICKREFIPHLTQKMCSQECVKIQRKQRNEQYKERMRKRADLEFKHGIVWVMVPDPTSSDGFKWVKEVRP